jgi:adenylosuccinate lyase
MTVRHLKNMCRACGHGALNVVMVCTLLRPAAEIAPEIRWHLERFAEPGERGFVFVGPKGGQLPTGATLKELMARLGHSSVRAAMIYQHATRDRDQAIAKALGRFVRDLQTGSIRTPKKLADQQ